MTVNDWTDIRTYQEIHNDLYEEAENSTEVLIDHLDPSCLIYNVADTARATTFDNFWYIVTTHFEAESWTNNTVIEFEHLRRAIRRYLSSEEDDDKVDAGQKAFHHTRRLLQTIRYKQTPEEDLEDVEHIIINTGVHTANYTQGERVEEVYQKTKLKAARRKQPDQGEPSGSGGQETSGTTEQYHDTRTSQTPPIPTGVYTTEPIAENPFGNLTSQTTVQSEEDVFIYPVPPTTTSTIVNPHTPESRSYHPAVPLASGTIVQDDSSGHQEPLNISGGRARSASPLLPITQSSSRNLALGGNPPPGISVQPNIYEYVPTSQTGYTPISTYNNTPTGIFGVNQ